MILISLHFDMTMHVTFVCYRVTQDYYPTISRKRVSWKLWFDPRFSRNFKLKWNLKWLSLDRGYFNFIFVNRDGLLNNLRIHAIPIRVLLCLVLSCFICLIVLFKCLEISDLLICYLSKKERRGNLGSILDFSSAPKKNGL